MKKNLIKTKEKSLEGYQQLLEDIKSILQSGLGRAYQTVDNIKVQTYWQAGERIVREELKHKERADYGQKVIEFLANDLKCSRALMFEIIQFYRAYPIVHTLYGQLSWSHYRILIKIKDKEEREFYEQQIMQNGWSLRIFRQEIKNKLYQRIIKRGGLVIKKRLPLKPIQPEQIFKDIYHFNFIELKKDYSERDFKVALLDKLEKFLQELGPDFFVGRREVPVLIGGNYDKIDLELFHAGLLCYILVKIKTEPFQHKHISQVYSYLNWYKENKMQEGQKLPVGLIICKTKDQETVHYALGNLKKEIFVAEYLTKLPSKEEIKRRLKALK